MLPDMSIIENGSNECVAQVFNYFDLLGGKDSMNGAEVERFLQVRGILEPKGGDYKQVLKYKKDVDTYNLVNKQTLCAGEDFELDYAKLDEKNAMIFEIERDMDYKLDPATFKIK